MAKMDLKKMTVKNLLDKIGAAVVDEDLFSIIDNIYLLEDYMDEIEKKQMSVIDIILAMPENIVKEKLVYATALNIRKMRNDRETIKKLEKLDDNELMRWSQEKDMFDKTYNMCIELLSDSNVEYPLFVFEEGSSNIDSNIYIEKILTMDYLLNSSNIAQKEEKMKQKNNRQIQEFSKNDELIQGLASISVSDYTFFLRYPSNAKIFNYFSDINIEKKLEEFTTQNPNAELKEIQKEEFIIDLREKIDFVRKWIGNINVDNLLLTIAYRVKKNLENIEEKELEGVYCNILKRAAKCIENPKAKISGKMCFNIEEKPKYIEYSMKQLEKDVGRIIKNQYYSDERIKREREEVLTGEVEVAEIESADVLRKLGFSLKEKRELINKNPQNLEYLVDDLEKEDILSSLRNAKKFKYNFMFIDYLYMSGNLNKENLVELYMNENLDLAEILELNENYDLQEAVKVDELINYYKKSVDDLNLQKDYEIYAKLFREVCIKDKENDEKEEIIEQISEKIVENTDDEKLAFRSLYKQDILPIQTLIEWNDEDIIYELIENQEIKPIDIKQLLVTGKLSLPRTYTVLVNSNLTDKEKMNFIFSSFDGTGENEEEIRMQDEARMYLIQAIKMSKTFSSVKEIDSQVHREKGTSGVKGNQYVSDPVYRWRLFSQIDQECSTQVYTDGTVKFTLPNVKNGTVVIEKMFKKTKEGNAINYGSATYVMSQEEFLKNRADIEQNGAINRNVLIEMKEEGNADKVVHSANWGKALKKDLDILVESGYSQEKITKIDELIEKIEKARQLV